MKIKLKYLILLISISAATSIKAQSIDFNVDVQKNENGVFELSIDINHGNPNFTILIYENPVSSDPVLKVTDQEKRKFTCILEKPASYYIEIRDSKLDIKGKSIRIQ